MKETFSSQAGAFIEAVQPAKTEPKSETKNSKGKKPASKAKTSPIAEQIEEIKAISLIDASIKSFDDLPASVINLSTQKGISLLDAFKIVGFEKKEQQAEPKSKRLNLLIRPSVYEAIKEQAQDSGQSVNDYINDILLNEVFKK